MEDLIRWSGETSTNYLENNRIQLQVTAALTRDLNPHHHNSWLVLILSTLEFLDQSQNKWSFDNK